MIRIEPTVATLRNGGNIRSPQRKSIPSGCVDAELRDFARCWCDRCVGQSKGRAGQLAAHDGRARAGNSSARPANFCNKRFAGRCCARNAGAAAEGNRTPQMKLNLGNLPPELTSRRRSVYLLPRHGCRHRRQHQLLRLGLARARRGVSHSFVGVAHYFSFLKNREVKWQWAP